MFGFKNNDNAKSGPFSLGSTTLIAEGTELEGDLHFKGNLEVEGSIVGNSLSFSPLALVNANRWIFSFDAFVNEINLVT